MTSGQWVLLAVAAVMVIAAVASVAYRLGRAFEDGPAPNDPSTFGASKNTSLFGPRVPVQQTERQLIAVMPEALIVTDALATVQYVSPGAQRFGLIEDSAMTLAEIRDILKLVSADSVVRERELAIPLDRAARAAAKNTNGKGLEAGKTLPADTLYLHVRVGQIADDSFAIFISDMSEQRRFEIMRRDFVTNVSHELKTPLHSIMGSAELLENGMVADADVPRFVGRIRAEAARLVSLIDDIIRLSQLDEGGEMPKETADLYEIAEEEVSRLRDEAEKKNVKLNLTGEVAIVNGVSRLLHEIVFNLCDNAIKYNRDGGSVSVDVKASDDGAVLTVSDTGIGIAPEDRQRVFERFYRVDKSRSKEVGGTGLGLSIVKHAVMDMGGSINLESTFGEGSTFTVTLSGANAQGAR